MKEQTIEVPLKVGTGVRVRFDDGTVFEDIVETHNPTTAKLSFENSDVGLAEFENMLNKGSDISIMEGR